MAFVATSSVPPPATSNNLQEALGQFERALTDDQRHQLRLTTKVPNVDAVLAFTAELDVKRNARGGSLATKLYSVLRSVRDFSDVMDTFVSSHPGIAALVWGSVKLTIMIALNFASYYEALSDLFLSLRDVCPRFAEYEVLYPGSTRVQKALCDFHASIVRCCKHVVEAISRDWPIKFFNSLWQGFQQEFKPDTDDIRRCSINVKDELLLAKAQADWQNAQEATDQRKGLTRLMSRIATNVDKSESKQLQRDNTHARERRQKLLALLSSHDHFTPLRQSCDRRHCDTTHWLFQTNEFDRWVNNDQCQTLWCSGKIGSGKTILAGSAVDYILRTVTDPNVFKTFFFHRFDDEQSLKASTVIRSLIRQTLDATSLSEEVEQWLQHCFEQVAPPPLVELCQFLEKRIASSKGAYIVIDGLDECTQAETDALVQHLAALAKANPRVKLLIFGRGSLAKTMTKHFGGFGHVLMNSRPARNDIATYIKAAVQDRIEKEDLMVGDPSLVNEITAALIDGSDGMFLWVVFQLDELCSARSDGDIRAALQDLPKDLEETFDRALGRILKRRDKELAQRTFAWVGVAKQPLTLEQMREVLPIEIGQPYSKRDQSINGMENIQAWCQNLVQVDEELRIVQFAHKSIHQFLSGEPHQPRFAQFHFNAEEADHFSGEICVTYLGFTDFHQALARRIRPPNPFAPGDMAAVALKNHPDLAPLHSMMWKLAGLSPAKPIKFDMTQFVEGCRGRSATAVELQTDHPFLSYASKGWIRHSSTFEAGKSKTWSAWKRLMTGDNGLIETPWDGPLLPLYDEHVVRWACDAEHYAFICLILNDDWPPGFSATPLVQVFARKGDLTMLNRILKDFSDDTLRKTGGDLLQTAAEHGHVEMVDMLLTLGTKFPDVEWSGWEKVFAAAERGYALIVEKLLAMRETWTTHPFEAAAQLRRSLRAAINNGHLGVVEALLALNMNISRDSSLIEDSVRAGQLGMLKRLLSAGAELNGSELLIAASKGHGAVFEELLKSRPLYEFFSGVLQAAARNGHVGILTNMLSIWRQNDWSIHTGEDTSAMRDEAGSGHTRPGQKLGKGEDESNHREAPCTEALQAAAEGGHLDAFKMLLEAGADVHAPAYDGSPRTVVLMAVQGGCLDVVQRAVEAGAPIDLPWQRNGYWYPATSLQVATLQGHLQMVKCILEAGVKVDARQFPAPPDSCPWDAQLSQYRFPESGSAAVAFATPLQIASRQGNLPIVEALIQAGADVDSKPGGLLEDNWHCAVGFAAAGCHVQVVERLLGAGADFYGFDGPYPIFASEKVSTADYINIAETFLQIDAEVRQPDQLDGTLHWAILALQPDLIARLLDEGAGLNDKAVEIVRMGWGRSSLNNQYPAVYGKIMDRMAMQGSVVGSCLSRNRSSYSGSIR